MLLKFEELVPVILVTLVDYTRAEYPQLGINFTLRA
jgi:hypothetical protein